MSTTPKDKKLKIKTIQKRRFKVTLFDRETGEKTTFELFSLGLQASYDDRFVTDQLDKTSILTKCVKLVMDYPDVKTSFTKNKTKKKKKKGNKNGK